MQPYAATQELIASAKAGNLSAFSQLYRQYGRRVFNICNRIVRNPDDAEDLTQEVFLTVFRKISLFRGDSAFTTWLYRVAVNAALMMVRSRKAHDSRLTPLQDSREDDEDDASYSKHVGIDDRTLMASIDRVLLERAVAQLAPGYRTVFLLHDVYGYEHHEIAAMLGCTAGNCKSQLHKARLRLRGLLLESEHQEDRVALQDAA